MTHARNLLDRSMALLLAFVMVLSMLPAIAAAAEDTSAGHAVRYLDADGNEKFATDYTLVDSGTTTMSNGWYVIKKKSKLQARSQLQVMYI